VKPAPPHEAHASRSWAWPGAVAFIAAVSIVWLATIGWPEPARPDLDPSWQQVLVDAWIQGRRFGHDLVFTWGPWGFLFSVFYLPGALDAKLWFEAVGRLGISALLVAVAWPLSPLRRVAWVAALALFSHNMFDPVAVAVIPAIGAAWLLPGDRPLRTTLGITALGGLALVKFTLLGLIGVVAAVGAGCLVADRRPKRAATLMAALGASTGLWWIGAGQQLGDFALWIRLSLDIAAGYASAMSLAPTPRFLAAGVLVLAAYAVWLLPALWMAASNRDRLVIAGMAVAPLLVAWKHGYTRADGHVMYFFLTALLMSVLLPVIAGASRWTRFASLAPMVASLVAFELAFPGVVASRPGDALARVRLSARRLADLPAFDRDFRHRFDAAASAARLPDEVRRAIGDSHVDLIGYSQGLLHLNGFEHRTRPVIQSYSAYTPFLAERNRAFLATDRAPAFLVASLETVDGRYPAQDDAPLLVDMPLRYELVYEEARGVLLKRRDVQPPPERLAGDLLLDTEIAPGATLDLPAGRTAAQWITIEAQPSLRARLRSLVLAPSALFMTLVDDGSNTVHTRVVPAIAADGFLLQPRLLGPPDLAGWVRGMGKRWNTKLTLGSGADDAANWQRFRVRVYRLPGLPIEAEGDVSPGSRD